MLGEAVMGINPLVLSLIDLAPGNQTRILYECPWVCTKPLSQLVSLFGMLGNLFSHTST
ncbi:hypothetical protein E2C01_037406 [Portunus trituberculatus]|uniref:Uncharacterized protein n=1 Tax=Portunus trituberculatus TaxID=210409 RepID=A0A5B7FH08_PORTR|nr:hypothetical protein [Portunus trituberculatus]